MALRAYIGSPVRCYTGNAACYAVRRRAFQASAWISGSAGPFAPVASEPGRHEPLYLRLALFLEEPDEGPRHGRQALAVAMHREPFAPDRQLGDLQYRKALRLPPRGDGM